MHKSLFIVLLVVLLISLSACGWHVRGFEPGAPSLAGVPVAVHSMAGPGALSRTVTAALQSAGADVVSPAPGVPTVVLYGERRGTRNISGARGAEIQEFELRYQVDWELRDTTGEPLIERSTFQQFRNYRFEQAQVLGSERREEAVVTELQRDFSMLLRDRVQTELGHID